MCQVVVEGVIEAISDFKYEIIQKKTTNTDMKPNDEKRHAWRRAN